CLDGRTEAHAPAPARRPNGEAHETGADAPVLPVSGVRSEPAPEPFARTVFPDPDDSRDFVGDPRRGSYRDDRGGVLVERVVIVPVEDPLLVAEDPAAQGVILPELPRLRRELERDVAAPERSNRLEDHERPSCAARVEQAPQRPHPARIELLDSP